MWTNIWKEQKGKGAMSGKCKVWPPGSLPDFRFSVSLRILKADQANARSTHNSPKFHEQKREDKSLFHVRTNMEVSGNRTQDIVRVKTTYRFGNVPPRQTSFCSKVLEMRLRHFLWEIAARNLSEKGEGGRTGRWVSLNLGAGGIGKNKWLKDNLQIYGNNLCCMFPKS